MFGMGALQASDSQALRAMTQAVVMQNWQLAGTPALAAQKITQPQTIAMWIATKYVNAVRGKLTAVPTPDKVLADPLLAKIVQSETPGSTRIGGGGGWGLNDQLIAGVDNWVLYAGGAVVGMLAWKKFGKKRGKK